VGREVARFAAVGEFSSYLDTDERHEIQTADPRLEEQLWRAMQSGMDNAQAQEGGGAALLLRPIVWLLWCTGLDVHRIGPTLLAELMVDGPLAARFPALAHHMPIQKWYLTALDYGGMRAAAIAAITWVVALILAIIAPGSTTLGEAFEKIRADAVARGEAPENVRSSSSVVLPRSRPLHE
jgi:hypothetical protein